MAINLKQILTGDKDSTKIDKINYNFDQLVSNAGGPRGFQGIKGNFGYQGFKGNQGNVGAQGLQGEVGVDGGSGLFWKENGGIGGNGNYTKALVLEHEGSPDNPPMLAIGYASGNDFYTNETVFNTSILINNGNNPNLQNNLELRSDTGDSESRDLSSFYFRQESNTMETGFILDEDDAPNSALLKQYAGTFEWFPEGGNVTPLISVNSTNLEVNVVSSFGNTTKIYDTLTINPGEITLDDTPDKYVVISTDTEGTLGFKDIEQVGGTVPIGTIVPVDPMYFLDKFIKLQGNEDTGGDEDSVKFTVGRGKNEFSGWYLCNGQTWTNGSDISYPTEDLNSFSYDIEDNSNSNNPNSQGERSVDNVNLYIVSGAGIDMTAAYEGDNYNIENTVVDTDEVEINQSVENSTTFIVKKLPQVVFLGVDNLYWQDKGTDQAPITTVTHTFTDNNTDGEVSTASFTDNSGNSGTFLKLINPPAKYYWDSNNLPEVSEITAPSGYTISSISLEPGGSYNKKIKIIVSYDSHPGFDTSIDFEFDSTNNVILIPESTIEFTFNNGNFVDASKTSTLESNSPYTAILPLDSTESILNFENNTLTMTADDWMTKDAYDDAKLDITYNGSQSPITATKSTEWSSEITEIVWNFSINKDDWPAGGTTQTHNVALISEHTLLDRMDFTVRAADKTKLSVVVIDTVGNNIRTDSYSPAAENTEEGTTTQKEWGSWIRQDGEIKLEITAETTDTANQNQQITLNIITPNGQNPINGVSPLFVGGFIVSKIINYNIDLIEIESSYYGTDVVDNTVYLAPIDLYFSGTNPNCEYLSTDASTYYIDETEDFSTATKIYSQDNTDSIFLSTGWFNNGTISRLWNHTQEGFTQTGTCDQVDDGGGDGTQTTQLYNIPLYEPESGYSGFECQPNNLVEDYSIDTQNWTQATKLYYRGTTDLVTGGVWLNSGPNGMARYWNGSQFDTTNGDIICGDGDGGTNGDTSTTTVPNPLTGLKYYQDMFYNIKFGDDHRTRLNTLVGRPSNVTDNDDTYAPSYPAGSDDSYMQGEIYNAGSFNDVVKPITVWPAFESNKPLTDSNGDGILPTITIFYKKYKRVAPDSASVGATYTGPLDEINELAKDPDNLILTSGWDNKHLLGSITARNAWNALGQSGDVGPDYVAAFNTLVEGWDSIEISSSSTSANNGGKYYIYGGSDTGIKLKPFESIYIAGWTWDENQYDTGPFTVFEEYPGYSYWQDPGTLSLGFVYKQTGDWDGQDFDGTVGLTDVYNPYPLLSDADYPTEYDDRSSD